jgi:putative ABC transport system permease protein
MQESDSVRRRSGTLGAVFNVLVIGGIRSDPLRALVAVGALAFATALAVGTHLTGMAATSGLLESGDELSRHADLQVVAPGRGVDERLFTRVRDTIGVEDARAVLTGTAVIGAMAGDPNSGDTVRIVGVDLLQPIPGASGSGMILPGPYAPNGATFDTSLALNGGAILSDRIASAHAYEKGDTFTVFADGRAQKLTVAYVLPKDVSGVDSATVFVDIATAQTLFASDGYIERIDCTIDGDVDATAARIAKILPPGTIVERPRANPSGLAALLSGLQSNLDWLTIVTLILAALFTYNAVGASVAQRRGDIATLRGLGANRGTIFRAFVCEGVTYGIIGSFGGALLGITGAQWAIARFVADATREAGLAFSQAELAAIAIACALGVAISTVCAALPAASAMRVPPASALGLGRSTARPTSPRYRAFARGAVGAIGATIGRRAPAAYLAAHELFATPRRTLLVLLALALAVANAIGYTVASSSFAHATASWARDTMRGDIVIAARDLGVAIPKAMPSPTLERVRAIAGVATAEPARTFTVVAPGRGQFAIRGDDSAAPQAGPTAAPDAVETPAFVTPQLAHRLRVRVGDVFSIATPTGAKSIRVAGTPDDFANPGGIATVRFARTAAWFRDDRADTIVATTKNGVDTNDVRERIGRTLASFALDVQTTRELRENTLALLDRSFSIAKLLGGIALGIAVAGVCALLATLVLERRATLGMLRYVGASRGFVGAMVIYEAALLAAFACVGGTIAGIGGALVGLAFAGSSAFGSSVPIDIPFGALAITLGITFVASLLASLPAARSAGAIGADARPVG